MYDRRWRRSEWRYSGIVIQREHFNIDTSRAVQEIRLRTPAGVVPIRIAIDGGRAVHIASVMDEFATFLYSGGVEALSLDGCRLLRVRDYCALDLAELERVYPRLDFTQRCPGPHLEIVNRLLGRFAERYEAEGGVLGMMYDSRPEGPGAFRIYPRFYGPEMAAAKLPYEFQCGTGTVAVCIALAQRGLLPPDEALGHIVFEWGSQRTTPDPYGIRTSDVDFATHAGRLVRASFSHSVVEILAEGRLTLPAYPLSCTTGAAASG